MKKILHILSFLSVAITALSCVAMVGCILLQDPLCQIFFYNSVADLTDTMVVPFGYVLFGLGNLAVALVLLFSIPNGSHRLSVPIICAVCTGVVLPFLRSVVQEIQTILTLRFFDDSLLIATSYLNSLCSIVLSPVGVASALMLVLCGMAIAVKYPRS